jgi:hypothetical protein
MTDTFLDAQRAKHPELASKYEGLRDLHAKK